MKYKHGDLVRDESGWFLIVGDRSVQQGYIRLTDGENVFDWQSSLNVPIIDGTLGDAVCNVAEIVAKLTKEK